MAMKYGLKADSIKTLVQDKLWNTEPSFFETMRGDASAEVREAIGYNPFGISICRMLLPNTLWHGRK